MSDFWARRKAAVAKETEAELALVEAEAAAEAEADLAERSDEEILAEFDLSAPENLDSPDAVRHFLTQAVPQRLKTRALRQLWKLNPVLANLDGLVDYGEDFTDSATVIENLQTAYQVGKGMLQHIEALAEKEKLEPEPEEQVEETVVAEAESDAAGEVQPEIAPEPLEMAVVTPEEQPREFQLTPSHRRMQFRFEESV